MIRLGRRGGVDKEDATAKPNAQHHVADYTLGRYGLLFISKSFSRSAATLSSSFTSFHLVEIHLVLNN